jgi:NADH-quinone oxidoreductase subunit I
MQTLTNKAKQVDRRPMTMMEKMYLPAIFKLCALACPAEAITMESAERQPGEEHLYREEKYAAKYEINMLRCIFCGLCEEACPKDAIYLSQTFAQANYGRQGFIYGKKDLLIPHPKENPEAYQKALGERQKASKE